MDLPERYLIPKVSSRMGLSRITFQPYSAEQLSKIISSRLFGIQIWTESAILLAAKKISALSGDARSALQLCVRATEISDVEGKQFVADIHVSQAYMDMFPNPKIMAVKHCSVYEKSMLEVVCLEFDRTGIEETTVGRLFKEFTIFLRTSGLQPLSLPGTYAMLARLSATRILISQHMKNGLETKIQLNMSAEELKIVLQKK